MSLLEMLAEDMKAAMREKESGKKRLSVIRMVRSSLKNVESFVARTLPTVFRKRLTYW